VYIISYIIQAKLLKTLIQITTFAKRPTGI